MAHGDLRQRGKAIRNLILGATLPDEIRAAVTAAYEELGGTDYISLNLYRTKAGALLRPCEMPEAKVIAFVRHLVVDAAPNGGRGVGSY